ncbi:FtsX-like permease family protein [Sphingomonas sp.]|uniref:FtsX-like permease family protein n=1 Tax=Sphingomonas sp. TaxID=28214 RepID=UPI002588DDC5|nr:FtsX-like permease family protein [Sphingomonas sp.]
MIRIAVRMLVASTGKFLALVVGIAFASFLSCFAACYFAGFMTRSFALVAEQPGDVWVMDRTTASPDQFANMTASARDRVRSVTGVADAAVLALGHADARMPDGRLQPFDVVGLDDATLAGAPAVNGAPGTGLLREPEAAIVDAGGSEGKLDTAERPVSGVSPPDAKIRRLRAGDELTIADHRVVVGGVSQGLPRFPPRPLLYMSWSNAARVLPPERLRTSFVVVRAAPGTDPADLARSIASQTGYVAFTRADFESATVQWFLATSEDVGDIATMLTIAVAIGFGFTTVMLYIFTADHLRQYAVLTALGARPAILWRMVAAQVSLAGLIGTGIGLGACALAGTLADRFDLPYRMMAWAPLGCLALNAIACAGAAVVSIRPVLRLEPARVFAA